MHSLISRLLLSSLLTVWLIAGLTACGYDDPPENTQVSPAVQKRFSRLDRDQDGRLTPDELNRPAIFQAADRNRDGYISLQEAGDYVQQRAARRRPDAPSPRSAVASLPEYPPSTTLAHPVSMRRDSDSPYDNGRSDRRKVAANGYSAGDEQYDDSPYDDQTDPSSYPEPRTTVAAPSPRMRLARAPDYDGVDAAANTRGVRKFLNLPYATIAGVDPNLLSLDVYAPAATGDNYPVIVMVHGGGWQRGDKANPNVIANKVHYFVRKGFIFVSINYRLSPMVKHPAHVQDVAKALAWIHKNIGRYSGNFDRIYLMGHSSGAHLAALVATDQRYLQAVGENLQLLKGIILLDGAGYDIPRLMREHNQPNFYVEAFGNDEQVWQDASPVAHVAADKGIPPFLIFYTPRARAQMLTESLRESLTRAGVPVRVKMVNKSHAQINREVGQSDDVVTQSIMDFLK